jgi:GntR family transcriptional regulator
VYLQIENHVRFAIASGFVKAGESLPSVRDLAQRLGVNPNTVTKAYRDLELLGIVATRRGVGVRVTPNAAALCAEETKRAVLERLSDATAECMAAGIPKTEIRQRVRESLDSGRYPYSGS